VTDPPKGPKGSIKVHPQTGPGEPPEIIPTHDAKQSEKIDAPTQEGLGGVLGPGAGAEGRTELPWGHKPLAGPAVGVINWTGLVQGAVGVR